MTRRLKRAKVDVSKYPLCLGCRKRKQKTDGLYMEETEEFTCFKCLDKALDRVSGLEKAFSQYQVKVYLQCGKELVDFFKVLPTAEKEKIVNIIQKFFSTKRSVVECADYLKGVYDAE